MRTITLGELQASVPALQQLATEKFTAKVAYRLSRILKSAESEMTSLKTAHFDLVKKLGVKVEGEGDQWRVLPENLEKFNEEMAGLLSEAAHVWGDPQDISLLGEVELEPRLLAALDWLIIDSEQPEPAPELVNGKTAGETVN